RHLDAENGKIRRAGLEAIERGCAVSIGHGAVTLGLEGDRDRSENIAVVVDESDGRHGYFPRVWRPQALKLPKQGRNVTNPRKPKMPEALDSDDASSPQALSVCDTVTSH